MNTETRNQIAIDFLWAGNNHEGTWKNVAGKAPQRILEEHSHHSARTSAFRVLLKTLDTMLYPRAPTIKDQNVRTIKELSESIQHWEQIVEDFKQGREELYQDGYKWGDNCALCRKFQQADLRPQCAAPDGEKCPVHADTSRLYCAQSPFADVSRALDSSL